MTQILAETLGIAEIFPTTMYPLSLGDCTTLTKEAAPGGKKYFSNGAWALDVMAQRKKHPAAKSTICCLAFILPPYFVTVNQMRPSIIISPALGKIKECFCPFPAL
jgi:hypothetical protein